MGRPKKDGVDYFSHDIDATGGRTIFTLESKYGNDGYAFWFKLLEILGSQCSLSYDCSDTSNWLFLVAKAKVSEEKATEILETLSQVGAIDKELWSEKVIWVEKFSERLDDVFRKRGTETPVKPISRNRNPQILVQPVAESTQSKVKESKGKKSRVENVCVIIFGSQENIKLTQAEYDRLVSEFPSEAVEAIEYLSLWIKEKGDTCKSETHNLTIRRWVIGKIKEDHAKQQRYCKPTFSSRNELPTEYGEPTDFFQ